MEGSGATVGVKYPGTMGHRLRPKISEYGQFHCPFAYSSGGVTIAQNVVEWLIHEDSHSLHLKIMTKLSNTHNHYIASFPSLNNMFWSQPRLQRQNILRLV
jgi:hypothetical protein